MMRILSIAALVIAAVSLMHARRGPPRAPGAQTSISEPATSTKTVSYALVRGMPAVTIVGRESRLL